MNEEEICEKCGLYKQGCKTPMLNSDGPDDADVLFIGEAPGAEEDKADTPFIGRSGQLLRNTISNIGFEDLKLRFTNVVKCRPPDNRTPKTNEIKLCSEYLFEEIKIVSPKVIVLLGNIPLRAVLGEGGITNWNGVVVEREEAVYVPVFHPAYVLRNGYRSDVLEAWIDAIRSVKKHAKISKGLLNPIRADSHYDYRFPFILADIYAMKDEILSRKDELVAYDVECISLYIIPENKVLSASFALSDVSWSFPIDHKDSWWSDYIRNQIIRVMEEILTKCSIVGHNIRYDRKMTKEYLDIDFFPSDDTLNISRLINPYKGVHGLKRLAGMYLGMFDYDKELGDYIAEHPECDYSKGGHYGNLPLEILLPYGGMDTVATWLLYEVLIEKLDDRLVSFYQEFVMGIDYALGVTEANGFKIDPYMSERYLRVYEQVKNNYYDTLLNSDLVQEARNKDKWKWPVFNPNSGDQMRFILFDYDKENNRVGPNARFTPTLLTEKAKRPSCKREVLLDIAKAQGCDESEEEFFNAYRNWSLINSMVSKNLGPAYGLGNAWHRGDYRARSNYDLGGTKGGRISSSKPNLQNIPTPEKEPGTLLAQMPIKNIFTHTYKRDDPGFRFVPNDGYVYAEGSNSDVIFTTINGNKKRYEDDSSNGCLLHADFSSAELRVIAVISGCEGMTQNFIDNRDPHCYVTRMVFGKTLELSDDITDKEIKTEYLTYRYRAKWTNWTLLYGGGWTTLVGTYGLSETEAKFIVNEYYGNFPEILDFQKKTIAMLEEYGYVESPFGRRLPIPDVFSSNPKVKARAKRTGINMPIQSTASDLLLMCLHIIHILMMEFNLKSMIVNTVHDSLIIDVYPGELTLINDIVFDVMNNVLRYCQIYYPNIDYSWMNDMPMKCDIDIGEYYGSKGFVEFEGEEREIADVLHNKLYTVSSYSGERIPLLERSI